MENPQIIITFIQKQLMKVCSLLTTLLIITLTNSHTFNCIFDKVNRDLFAQAENNVPEVPVIQPGRYVNGRLLQSTSTISYGSMRIELEYSQFTSSTITAPASGTSITTTARLNFILNALFVTEQFFQKRLQAGQLSFVTIPSYCVDFTPSNVGGTIANTELLIFAQYLTDKNKAYGATGKSCDWVTGSLPDFTLQVGRPSVGRIIFNTYSLVDQESSLTNRLFQSVTTTTIHEVTHILGFDSTLYSKYLDPSTGNYYATPVASASVHASRPATKVLQTPYVKAWAINHFGCSSLPGMLLQNQDGTGTGSASHWQRTSIYDELMTATSFGASKGIFGVTYALLKDTGWYLVDDTFSQTTNYGYNKGCSFVLDACYSNTSFPEFCNSASLSSISSCQTTFFGKAKCDSSSSNMADSCGIYVPYFNCVDPTSTDAGYQPYTYEAYSTNSFCVKSTLGTVTIPSTLQSRCYPYFCNTSSIIFTVGSYSITCLSTEAGVTKTLNALTGSLTCPIFSQFCTVSRKTCPNWCSQHGFCTGGICNCNSGYKGSDCSITNCGQYVNAVNSNCISSCTTGLYLNIYSNTCQKCNSKCLQCTGTPSNCVGCVSSSNQKYSYNGSCISSCPSTTFVSSFNCTLCDTSVNCLTCTGSSTYCTSCQPGTYLNQGTCVATCTPPYQVTDTVNKQCVSSCPSYLLSTASTCVFCANNTYYFQGSCVTNCTSNASSIYYPDNTYHACLQCSSSCLTCDGPNAQNCTSCKNTSGNPYLLLKMCWSICPKGYFANTTSGKCQNCPTSLNCQSCKYNTSTATPYCTSCIYGTFYSSSNSTCSSTCNTSQYKNTWNNSCSGCDSACATCSGPSSFSCLSCPGVKYLLINITGGYCLTSCPTTAYVQVGTTCQSCDNTCLTCNGVSPSQCATCQSGYYLNSGYCRYICPSGTYPNATSKQCLGCDSSCSYCFDGTAQGCTSCQGTKYLYNFTCIQNCPNGLTPNQWNVCFQGLYSITILGLALLMGMF